jgi:hypothetical protein
LNLRTISAETKTRLLREADAAHGWQLKQKKEEVLRVKECAQVKAKRLLETKRTLTEEMQAVKKAKEDAVSASTMHHKKQLSNAKKMLKEEMVTAKVKHDKDVAKLNRQNEAMRKHAAQRPAVQV